MAFVAVAATRADAQVASIAGSVATGMAIEQIAERLRSLIERAEQAGDFLAQRAGQEALYVLDAFERASVRLLDTAFRKIGDERQAILNQLNKIAEDIEKGRIDTLNRLEETSDQWNRLVRDRTFSLQPVIFRYRGSIVTPGETQDVRLIIDGYRLTQGTPHLLFRGKRYDARKDGENLRFELPRSLFTPEETRLRSEDATLILEGREGGFLGMFTRPVTVEYDLNLVTLPSHLAAVEVTYETKVSHKQERIVSISENHNSSRRSWDCRSYVYSPATKDRRFDVDRSYVRSGPGNSRGQLRDLSIRDIGISFRLCAKRRPLDRDNGYRHAVGQYVEVWETTTGDPRSKSTLLQWTENAVIPVDDPIDRLLITVRDFAGVSRTVPLAGGHAGRYAIVRYDAQSKVVIVNPEVPGDLKAL